LPEYKRIRGQFPFLEHSLNVARNVVKRQALNGEYAPWITRQLQYVTAEEHDYCSVVREAAQC